MIRLAALFVALVLPTLAQGMDVIHREKSLYRNIEVKESGSRRCLVFAVKRGDRNQSCMDLRNPNHVVFPYARMTFSGLLLNDEPASFLIVGLGGGTLPMVLSQMYPDAVIDVIEIDPAVNRVAQDFFDFRETEKMKVHVIDARVFVKRAALKKQSYDYVILDAFTGDYIPEHLMTVEFLEETKAILGENGVLVANTFTTSELYSHESETYRAVFGEFFNFKMPITGNRIIVAGVQPLPQRSQLRGRANRMTGRMTRYRVNIEDFPRYMRKSRDWDESARPLTDQYSPVNLLQGETP